MRKILTPLASACLLATLATPLQASPYSGMAVFGDSLSDAGQFGVRFTTQLGAPYGLASASVWGNTAPMFINDRLGFSPQTASAATSTSNSGNWAVGGYTTSQILGTVNTYVAGGRVVDSNTLFYLNGGGNDFLADRLYPGLLTPAYVVNAANNMKLSLQALQAAGGRYFMMPLLVDVLSPGQVFNQNTYDMAQLYNNELIRHMASLDAEVIPLNVPLLYREVLANPNAYGFDGSINLLNACFNSSMLSSPAPVATNCATSVWSDSGATPNPDKLIYADAVHPTTAMQRILADQAYSILAAPWEISLLPEAGMAALRGAQDHLRGQWQADWGQWQGIHQWQGYAGAGGQRHNLDGTSSGASGKTRAYSLNAGASYRLDEQWRVGLALDVQEQRMKLGQRNSKYDLRSYLASAFAQYHDGFMWFDGSFTAGYLDYHSLERRFSMGITTRTEKGSTDGYVAALGGRLGVELGTADPALKISPFVSADYSYLHVDGYAEKGASSTALSYDRQRRESQRLGAGVQARYQFTPATAVFGEILREKEFGDSRSDVNMHLNSVRGVDFELKGYEMEDRLTRFSLGFKHQISQGLALQGAYNYRHGANDALHGANLAVVFDW